MILIFVLYAFLASTFILAKHALAYAQPCFLVGFRMIIAGLILLGFQAVRDRRSLRIARSDMLLFVMTAVVHIYIAYILDFWSLQYLTALKSTLIYSSSPFVAAVLSYILLKERLSWQKVAGIVVGLLGIVPVIMASSAGEATMTWGSISLPEVALMCAVVSAAYAWFLVKRLMERGYSLAVINGQAMLMGGLMSLVTSLLIERHGPVVSAWGPFLTWIIALIVVANIIFYNLYGWLLRRYSITFLAFAGFLCPGFGMVYAWLFESNPLTWHYPVSLVLVTIGLYIFYQGELKSFGLHE